MVPLDLALPGTLGTPAAGARFVSPTAHRAGLERRRKIFLRAGTAQLAALRRTDLARDGIAPRPARQGIDRLAEGSRDRRAAPRSLRPDRQHGELALHRAASEQGRWHVAVAAQMGDAFRGQG